MEKLTLKELAIPLIRSIDSFNYLLKSHHRRTAIIAHKIGKELGIDKNDMVNLVIAASLHDVGALSVQERDLLVQIDVEDPLPHCHMGYKMLATFESFDTIARIIKHHHIYYSDVKQADDQDVLFLCQIIHLADRVDVLTHTDKFILNQKQAITDEIVSGSGTTFNPEIVDAFLKVSRPDIFWIKINNTTIEELFNSIDFSLDFELKIDDIISLAQTISKIVDFRSHFTVSHSCTVANIASTVAEIMKYPKEVCLKLMIAGYLHDIGKIGIDPGIIEKNGPLTEEEYNQIKLHPYYTEQILIDLGKHEWFNEIITWSKYHHEKTDGSGYPYAISNENICDQSKILVYADILSALLENRPYRQSLSMEETLEIIEREIAPKLSMDIFKVIKENKERIQEISKSCQLINKQEYSDIIV